MIQIQASAQSILSSSKSKTSLFCGECSTSINTLIRLAYPEAPEVSQMWFAVQTWGQGL